MISSHTTDPELLRLLRQAVEYVKGLSPEANADMVRQRGESWVRAEMAFGDEGTRTA